MDTAVDKKITRITDSRLWDRFTDSLVTSAAILGVFVLMSYFGDLPTFGFPAGTAVTAAFATLALTGKENAFPGSDLNAEGMDQFVFQTMLGMGTGFLLSFIGSAVPDRTVFVFAGAVIVPVSVAYPLLRNEGVGYNGVVRNIFRPTLPHIVLWAVEFSCPDPLSALFLGGVCTIIEEFSFLIRNADNNYDVENVKEFRRVAGALYPTFLILAGSALMCAEGTPVKTCTLMVLGLGAGLLAGKAIGMADIIQLTAGVAVASAISFLAYI